MAADRVGTDTGDPLSARCPTPPPCSYLALAVSTWLAGDACPVIVHITPTDWLCSVVSHTASAVHPAPPAFPFLGARRPTPGRAAVHPAEEAAQPPDYLGPSWPWPHHDVTCGWPRDCGPPGPSHPLRGLGLYPLYSDCHPHSNCCLSLAG